MSLDKPSNPSTAGFEYSIITEAQGKDLKINNMRMIEVLIKETNESHKEFIENTKRGRKLKKKVQDLKAKIESRTKDQSKENLEIKTLGA